MAYGDEVPENGPIPEQLREPDDSVRERLEIDRLGATYPYDGAVYG